MDSPFSSSFASTSTLVLPEPTISPAALLQSSEKAPTVHSVNPIVAFIIGLAIILLASVLNAAGLNLTKLDHVRTSAIPRASRRKDWLRPLWLLGMLLYILSQLIGSTLALEYMRAEYVAPLGSSSLVFNFLFARFLVGTPVTSTDIYGTIIVVLGVIGIVAFGSINSGLATATDVKHLTYLWRRGGWLGFFFTMAVALILLFICTARLDAVLSSRSDLSAIPLNGSPGNVSLPGGNGVRRGRRGFFGGFKRIFWTILGSADKFSTWIGEWMELWTAAKNDKTIAWTLGIGWACCGGGLAGGCLVFAKATVKLISGSLSHENPGNQFGHAAPIFTIILLATTAVMQIICLNRGLKVYDSTLVVPVFYGVYTATGFLDSLIFNDEVDSYKSWTLFLIFVSILVLISGVVLLTHKKPEPSVKTAIPLGQARPRGRARVGKKGGSDEDADEADALRPVEEGEAENGGEVLWAVGNASDDDDDDDHSIHRNIKSHNAQGGGSGVGAGVGVGVGPGGVGLGLSGAGVGGEEGVGLIGNHDDAHEDGDHTPRRRSESSDKSRPQDPFRDNPDGDEFGEWSAVKTR